MTARRSPAPGDRATSKALDGATTEYTPSGYQALVARVDKIEAELVSLERRVDALEARIGVIS